MSADQRIFEVTQEEMERMQGAAHAGAMIGGQAAYEACLKVEGIIGEIWQRNYPRTKGASATGKGE